MTKSRSTLFLTLGIMTAFLSACSNPANSGTNVSAADGPAKDAGTDAKPITLKFYNSSGTFTNTEFKTFIADPVHKRFPNITVERIEPPSGTTPEDFFTSGADPDLIYASSTTHSKLINLSVLQDLREYIKKYSFDESRVKPYLYNYAKGLSSKGEILAIPFNSNQHILYYNKDIFDKFGVPYPPDTQMTWEQAIELGQKLTRTENGVNYIGIDAEGPIGLAKSLALPIIDLKTNKSVLTSPDWVRVFNIAKLNYDIQGYVGKDGKYVYGRDEFMKDRNLAMRPTWLANMVGPLEELRQQGLEVNWDIAPIPTFSDHLGQTRESQVHTLSVSNKSKHKDEAFQAISFILSDEVQRTLSRNGRVPAIVNPELEKEYGADLPVLKGKKVQNVFVGSPLQEHTFHPYEIDVQKYVNEAAKSIAIDKVDVNTALRKASEEVDKAVERFQKNN